MSVSNRFQELNLRLRELRKHLLPAKFSPTGDYSDRQLEQARGYRLLVHAEIEAYLEDIAKKAVMDGITKWKRDRKPSILIIAFLAAYHSSWNVDDNANNEKIIQLAKERAEKGKIKDSIDKIIDLAQTQFIRIIKENNGIKEKNFKSLILPLGIDIEELDNTWVTDLDNFGSIRGEIAHKSKNAITHQIDPLDEYNKVKSLLIGLKDLDRRILEMQQ